METEWNVSSRDDKKPGVKAAITITYILSEDFVFQLNNRNLENHLRKHILGMDWTGKAAVFKV